MTDDDAASRSRSYGRSRDRRDYLDVGSEAEGWGRIAASDPGGRQIHTATRSNPDEQQRHFDEGRNDGYGDRARDRGHQHFRGDDRTEDDGRDRPERARDDEHRQERHPRQRGDDSKGDSDREDANKDQDAGRRKKRRPFVIGIDAIGVLLMIAGGIYG